MVAGRDTRPLGAQGERLATRGGGQRPDRALGVAMAYVSAGGLAALTSILLGRNPVACESWLGARGIPSVLLSVGLGLPLGAVTIAATRVVVQRSRWAHALHAALRPTVSGTGDAALLVVAAASSAGEELLFRGLLVPLIGVVVSSVVFGGLHQVRGPARWGWMGWATVMGLLFGSLFAATGSLAGPLVAHAAINHSNLRFLRDNDPDERPRALGGLLRR